METFPQPNIHKDSILGDSEQFMASLEERAKDAKPEEVIQLLTELERYAQIPDRKIEVYTDPQLRTFCCGQVPGKKVDKDGNIVDDPFKPFTYLIGVPFVFVAGRAPMNFLQGEILHERGHAKATNFDRMNHLRSLALQDGYDPDEILSLDNCIEDPRMERVTGGPNHPNERRLMFEKNRVHIIPNIAGGFKAGESGQLGMPPTDQFRFLLKLVGLWSIYGEELRGESEPWDLSIVNPLVRTEFEKIKPTLLRIVGDPKIPPLKRSDEVEKLIAEEIWPAFKRIIDQFPPQKNKGGDGKSEGGKGGKIIDGGFGGGLSNDPEAGPLDQSDPDNWPEPYRSVFKKMKKEHQQRLGQEADKKKKENGEKAGEQGKLDKKADELAAARGEIENRELREKFYGLRGEVAPFVAQLKSYFKRLIPKNQEEEMEWGNRGIRFDARRLSRQYGTGRENPMGRRIIPENNALVLQLLVDVSGSMKEDRIKNAVKACIAVCEAAKDSNIIIEILASDEENVGEDGANAKYLIKDFKDEYGSKVKLNLVLMLEAFCTKGNEDAAAIKVALPRLKRGVNQARREFDRVGSLTVFVSDSTTQDIATREAANESRKSTPFEGTAITPEADIPEKVKFHFGENSIIPRSLEEFPQALAKILERHIAHLKNQS